MFYCHALFSLKLVSFVTESQKQLIKIALVRYLDQGNMKFFQQNSGLRAIIK